MTIGMPMAMAMARRVLALIFMVALCGTLSSCGLPQVSAEDRLFWDVSAELVGTTVLEKQTFDGEPVGGISAIAYDVPRDRIYALSDNRTRPRFYTLALKNLTSTPSLTVESVTYLKDAEGAPYPSGTLDPEGLAITPSQTLLISSEGSPRRQVPPAIGEYDIETGQLKQAVVVPTRYFPNGTPGDTEDIQTQGVQENLSFEALAVNVSSGTGGVYEPYRFFVATEGPLLQDLDFAPEIPYKNRLLHYTVDPYQTMLISEHLYEMDIAPTGAVFHGLPEIAVLDQAGHFLALERSYGFQGFAVKLYQLASGGATDISTVESLQGDTSGINPIQKELILDLATLEPPLQNYEAMTFGPELSDGTLTGRNRSLMVMSDDNFDDGQETRLLIFRLTES
ncbi:MAG: esterase-like activity of phytase family protein [Cyanobacteria bacterium J06643_4]